MEEEAKDQLKDMLKKMEKMANIIIGGDENYSEWIQVGKLNKVDLGLRRANFAKMAASQQEGEMYKAKFDALKAVSEAQGAEWWVHIKKTYGLPTKGDFHITDDGRIVMRPKGEE